MAEYFDHHCKGAPAPKWMTDGVPFHAREDEKLPFAKSYVDAHVKPAPEPAVEMAAKPAKEPQNQAAAAVEAANQPGEGEAAAVPATKAAGNDAAKGRTGDGERPAGNRRGRARGAAAEAAPKLQRGAKAPDFALADQAGKQHTLADYRGKHVLVWFYPKADTPGCTAQGCGLRDEFAEFERRGVVVLGVSVDDAAANAAFQQKHDLPFPLLCDSKRTMGMAYGACDSADARAHRRIAVLLDGTGKVVQVWQRVDPKAFAASALAALPL
jgi:peroxiredoxin Q/BCP